MVFHSGSQLPLACDDDDKSNWALLLRNPLLVGGAVLAGLVSAAPLCVPTLMLNQYMVLPVVADGILIGLLVGWICKYCFIRNVYLARTAVWLALGVNSAVAAGLIYVNAAFQFQQSHFGRQPADALDRLLDGRAFADFDSLRLIPDTGTAGIVGFARLLWLDNPAAVVVGIDGFPVILFGLAMYFVLRQVRQEFCDSCNAWLTKPRNLVILDAEHESRLIQAVQVQDELEASALCKLEAGARLNSDCVYAKLVQCPKCGINKVFVVRRIQRDKGYADHIVLRAIPSGDRFIRSLHPHAL